MRHLILLCGAVLWAQAPLICGTDLHQAEYEAAHPEVAQLREVLERAAQAWIERHAPALRTQSGCPASDYVIPVVVHIIHSGAGQPDSLPLSRVLQQMEQLFNDYRKRPYTKGYSSGVDTRIEFSLATKDPSGNPHSGVTYTHYTAAGLSAALVNMSGSSDNATTMKTNVGWPRNKYLNIWVINQICVSGGSNCNILGFALFPDGSSDVDEGVVVISSYFGNMGGGQTTTHEIGHYLNLYHTFQGGCSGTSNGNCGAGGDRVCDTPPTYQNNFGGARRQNTCQENTSATGGDRPDQVRNYMDYLDDASLDIFTEGQRVRMSSALQTYSDRQQWQNTNLQATGTGPWGRIKANLALQGCEQPPCYVCPGQSITLQSYSWGQPNQFQWEIRQGATVVASSTQGPCATLTAPNTPGTYDVYLSVTNQAGSDDTVYTGFLIVRDPAQVAAYPFSEGFESTTFPPLGWVRINPDFAVGNSPITWDRYSSTGRGSFGASHGMARIRNFSYPNRTQRDYLITPPIAIPSSAQNPVIEFDVYYRALYWENASASPPIYGYLYGDTLRVSISNDCGTTWTTLYYKGGEDLDVTGQAIQVIGTNLTSAYQALPPAGPNTAWRHEVVPIPASYIGQTVLIRFENITEMGNNLFIDSVQVRDNLTTSLPSPAMPVLTLAPNPAAQEAYLLIKGAAGEKATYRLLSLTGQVLQEKRLEVGGSDFRYVLPVADLPAGVYVVEVLVGTHRQLLRLVKE